MKSLAMKALMSSTGGINVIVNLILSGLGIFTQARPYVAAKSHNVEEEIID